MYQFFATYVIKESVISKSYTLVFTLIPFFALIMFFVFVDTKDIPKTCTFFVINAEAIFSINRFILIRGD